MKKYTFEILFAAAAILLGTTYLIYALFNTNAAIPFYMIIYFEAFIIFFASIFLTKKFLLNKGKDGYKLREKRIFWLIIISGVIFRITLFPATPSTSPDVYRYIWEGKVIANGYNPYVLPPVAPELNHLHSKDLPSKINFNEMTAIYPPFSQVVFTVAYYISGESFWGLKVLYLLFEILTFYFLYKILILKDKPILNIILYAWLPLPVLEFFVNLHLDPIGIPFLLMFIYLLEKEKYKLSAAALAISFLSKLYPLFLLPLLIKKLSRKNLFIFYSIFSLVVVAFYIPFYDSKLSFTAFLLKYLVNWEFNGSAYSFFKFLFQSKIAHIICGFSLISGILIISFLYKDILKAILGIFLIHIIFNTTLYPWYLGWIAALNVFFDLTAITTLAFLINLSNFTPLSPIWHEYTSVKLLEYIPFYSLLIKEFNKIAPSAANLLNKFKFSLKK